MFSFIGKLLSKIWNLLKKALPYVLLAAAIFFTAGGVIPLAVPILGGLSGAAAAWGALGASLLIAPGETAAVLGKAADATGQVASDVISTTGELIGTLASSAAGSLLPFVIVGGTMWFLLSRKKKESEKVEVAP